MHSPHHELIASWAHCSMSSLHNALTAPWAHFSMSSLHHEFTLPWAHCTMSSLHNAIRAQLMQSLHHALTAQCTHCTMQSLYNAVTIQYNHWTMQSLHDVQYVYVFLKNLLNKSPGPIYNTTTQRIKYIHQISISKKSWSVIFASWSASFLFVDDLNLTTPQQWLGSVWPRTVMVLQPLTSQL